MTDDIHKFHFEEPGVVTSKPYRMQGDARFEDPEILEKRNALKDSAKLRSAILQFWTTVGLEPDAHMTKENYIYIHRRLSRALAPELSNAEAVEAAEEEWQEDLGGADYMTFALFSDSIYGLADLWTDAVSELDYVMCAAGSRTGDVRVMSPAHPHPTA